MHPPGSGLRVAGLSQADLSACSGCRGSQNPTIPALWALKLTNPPSPRPSGRGFKGTFLPHAGPHHLPGWLFSGPSHRTRPVVRPVGPAILMIGVEREDGAWS